MPPLPPTLADHDEEETAEKEKRAEKEGTTTTVVSAARAHEPHRVAFYLMDLAAAFHALWTAGRETPSLRFIREDAPALTAARLRLVKATALVIRSGLGVLAIDAREEM